MNMIYCQSYRKLNRLPLLRVSEGTWILEKQPNGHNFGFPLKILPSLTNTLTYFIVRKKIILLVQNLAQLHDLNIFCQNNFETTCLNYHGSRTATMFFMFFMFFKERNLFFCSLKNAFLCKMFFILMKNGYFFTISVIT